MTHEEVKALVEEMGLPYAYDHFAEGESPDPPFICFLYPKAENFGADNLVYHHFNRLDIEVYTDYKDPDMEASIEEVLTAHELYYEKSEVWIETEKMYEVLYDILCIFIAVWRNVSCATPAHRRSKRRGCFCAAFCRPMPR